jgi:lysozyme
MAAALESVYDRAMRHQGSTSVRTRRSGLCRRARAGVAATLLAGGLVAGCSSTIGPAEILSPVSLTTTTTATSALPYADSDPIDFGPRTPALHPVHGIDVSKYQGEIDWPEVRKSGVAFAFIKATEGGDRVDDRFGRYWRGASAAGIPHAPYHFYYFCTPAEVQARWFIRNVPKSAAKMPPVLDMEWNPASPSCKLRPDPATVRREMKTWLDIVEKHFGRKAIIYTTVDFHRENVDGHFRDHQFWLRSVAAHPGEIYPGHPWTFWQYTGTGKMPGIKGDVDINAFAGTRAEWTAWLAKHGG